MGLLPTFGRLRARRARAAFRALLHPIWKFRLLRAERTLQGGRLKGRAELHFRLLERRFRFRARAPLPESAFFREQRRRFARIATEIPAYVEVNAAFEPVVIRNISGGGLVIEPAPALPRGESTTVRTQDPATGRAYAFSAQPVWVVRTRERSAMALRFIGKPA